MSLQIRDLTLVGADREVSFRPGLNIVVGPISTGKSSLMQLLATMLGVPVRSINPEVDSTVSSLAGTIVVQGAQYAIVRPLVQTDTAPVQIAGDTTSLTLPANRPNSQGDTTFGRWMLAQLGLPDLRVPAAPTKPEESETTPVSLADYLAYCRLRQDEVDVDVLGSSKPFRDIKRRYVFRILYGSYDASVAALQQQLRTIETELRGLQQAEVSFSRFLTGTPLENRAALELELAHTRDAIASHRLERGELAEASRVSPAAIAFMTEIRALDSAIVQTSAETDSELSAASELAEFVNQLETQSARLTRAVVAGTLLHDFDFAVCPRCGQGVSADRADNQSCYLCLQEVRQETRREDLIREQERIRAQVEETEQLTDGHRLRAEDLREQLARMNEHRDFLGRQLDDLQAAFVSDNAETIARQAREVTYSAVRETQLIELLAILDRLSDTQTRIAELSQAKERTVAELGSAEQRDSMSEGRIERLEAIFSGLVDEFEIPEFGGQPRAAIDRTTLKPIVNARPFEALSAGVRVLVSVAHILAHHLAAFELDLPLPGIILMDGIQKNIGTAEYDAARTQHVWRKLVELSNEIPDSLQVIVAANDVPEELSDFVRLELSHPDNRLIPSTALDSTSA